jgi:PAS domain S-box-containing protein
MENLITKSDFYETIDLIITPVILATSDTECQYINKAFSSRIGYSKDDIHDQNAWFNRVYPDPAYREDTKTTWRMLAEAAKTTGDSHAHMITKICCADGSYKWFDLHENIYGDIKVVTFLDVNELQESNEELTDALSQKDILLSVIAHDVRSPLGNIRQVINGYKEMDLSADEMAGVFAGILPQIDYIFSIINSLLIRTSADKGSFVEKREDISLQLFFAKYGEYYRDRLEQRNIRFVFDFSELDTIHFDPFILDVISRNVIDNAIKYSPENGFIFISFSNAGNYSEITIRDIGPGMSATQSQRILNNQGSRRLKNQITDSFGLGLIMAKEILEKHNGKLKINSEVGKGTSFKIEITN